MLVLHYLAHFLPQLRKDIKSSNVLKCEIKNLHNFIHTKLQVIFKEGAKDYQRAIVHLLKQGTIIKISSKLK